MPNAPLAAEPNAQPPASWLDLFVRPQAESSAPAARHRLTAPWPLGAGAADTSDTPGLAAWFWLQERWLSRFAGEAVVAAEARQDDSGTTKLTRIELVWPANASVLACFALIDAQRERGVPVAGPDHPEAVWLTGHAGDDAMPVAQAPLVVGRHRGADGEPDTLVLDVDASLVPRAQAQVLLDTLVRVAQAMLDSPDAPWTEIDVIDPATRTQWARWNPPLRPFDPALTVPGAFARQVRQRPDAIAVVDAHARLTYAALDARSDAMARRLRQAGVQPGATVCIALGRSCEAIVALLGILKAGAAYLPVDPSHPPERLAFMLDDTGATLILTTRPFESAFPAGRAIWFIDESAPQGDATALDDPSTGESLAYVMYTSGSTGVPKGIQIRHLSILRLVLGADYVQLSPDAAVMHAAPLGFDASTLEIWGPLLNGGRCVLHDEALPTPQGLAATIRRERVTTAWLTAALFNAVVDDDPAHLRGLKQLLIGGEALSVPHVRRALAALPETQIINGYGPTECTTFTCTHAIPRELAADARAVPIGRPITDTPVFILSPTMQPLPIGLVGELYVGGRGLARGYLQRDDLTARSFVANPFTPLADDPSGHGGRLYRTGDLVRYLADGSIDFIGRADGLVKVRGFRIELGEIETALAAHPAVQACAVVAGQDAAGGTRLIAYAVARRGEPVPVAAVREYLARRLPEFMVPAAMVWMAALPITVNGKLDRRALPQPASQRPELTVPYQQPRGDDERRVCEAFAAVLGLDGVGRADNFFDLGGNSLLVLRLLKRLSDTGTSSLTTAAFFRGPTPAEVAAELAGGGAADALDERRLSRAAPQSASAAGEPIALVAMAGRFPGANTVEQFWRNLCEGRDSITDFADADLDPSLPTSLTSDPDYVKSRGVIDGVEMFDAAFFGISPREADLMDPQQRVFMELCWECLERGGVAPDATTVPVGVFAGMNNATYFQRHVSSRPDLVENVGEFPVMLANEKDYVTTRVAYRLNLTGPAVSVNTACSTSLVAIGQAFASLRAGQCDMALAGGVSITCPPRSGYLYQDGAMLSPDGRTRSFDAKAQGTGFNDGAAVVLLKRLSDALADGDTIHAVIRSVAINNDGRDKASFTAPSVDGQAAVIAAAQAAAGIEPRSISYVETHGTATPLGDPIEVAGLTRAFRRGTPDVGFCRIGSVKSNVGHLVIAAGATGVIKTALALAREQLPPSIHFDAPNPNIEFEGSPFVVNDQLSAWPRGNEPRRAGVSSFGVGGTNAHAVMEEAPQQLDSSAAQGPQLLMLSARSRGALDGMTESLAAHLEADSTANLADVAFTLQRGRSRFAHRLCVVADSARAAVAALRSSADPLRAQRAVGAATPPLAWLFPGQGAQYAGMGSGLHAHDPVFRAAFDECAAALQPALSFDLAARMFGGQADALTATSVTQPATFCLEVALAQSWLARGVQPVALVGHSVGEFAAAVVAGVMSLADAARLVALRGAMMQAMPAGAMLSVRMTADALMARLPAALSLSAENAANACVVGGTAEAIEAFRVVLESEGIAARTLQTSHAFHTPMMDPVVAAFEAEVRRVALAAPRLPIASTLTGTWLTAAQATDPHYWARHLREPVRFSAALRTVLGAHDAALLEVGPRGSLCMLARQHTVAGRAAPVAIASLMDMPASEAAAMTLAHGQLWTLGLELPGSAATPAHQRRRVVLPTYPFERKRHWIDAPVAAGLPAMLPAAAITAPAATTVEPVPADTPAPAPARLFAIAQAPAAPSLTDSSSPTDMSTPSSSASRRPQLLNRLRTVFEDVAGMDLADADPASSFVELGLDSLTLTQAAMQVKKQFKVAITFRQLMERYRSFDTLVEFLDGALPPEAAPAAPATPAAAAPAAGVPTMVMPAFAVPGHGAPQGLVQQVIQQQMQLMAQQLALLGGAPAAMPAIVSAEAATSAPAPATPTPVASAAATPSTDESGAIRYDVKKAFGAIARIHTQASALTERQRARLDAFMRRYVERTQKSKAYTVEHRPHMADPRVVNGFRPMIKEITYQVVIERSKGSRVWDIDGNEYVDTLNGFGMNLFGWQPDFVVDAVKAQIDRGYEIGPQHPLAGDVCKLICELTGSDRAAMCNTGSEAVMAAVRIARTVTGRSTVVLFTGSYHGTFDEVLVRAGRGAKGIPAAPGIMAGVFGDARVLEYGTPEALQFIRDNADDLAAVLVEPVQSRRPDFQPLEFLKEVRAITEASGTCFIFDEVITGFRSHIGGAQAHFGIRADLASYGKVIGGGMPIGVVAGKREYMDALDGGAWDYGDDSMPTVGVTYFAGTFVRHPLALAAAKASLEHLKQHGTALQTQLNERIAAMAGELTAFCREVGAPMEVRHFASLWRVAWLEEHPLQDLLFAMMRSRGVHILDNFPNFMTTAHTDQDLQLVMNAFKESVRELQESDFLPQHRSPVTLVFDASKPPVPGARLGKDPDGKPAWFIRNPDDPARYVKVSA